MAADVPAPESIAIVGASCRLPGGSNNPDSLWSLLSEGTSAWTPVPGDRFNEAAFQHPSLDDPNGTSNHLGGHFISGDVRDFDHGFFRLSPAQAAANLSLMPDPYIGMSNFHMTSSRGRCYPFDVRGEGYGRGEGFVVVVLKRLRDAIRDRDPIRSVILGTAVNQDGHTPEGITHPSRSAQADLIRSVYARLGLRPHDVAYVEAHGTGTVAGNHEELAAIADVFTGSGRSLLPLYVGSNKGSIGHTESTSGLASVLKAALILDRETIPPVVGFANPKPGLPLDEIWIPSELIPWPYVAGVTPRVSVNSFGYGGTNAHAILERGPRVQHDESVFSPSCMVPSHRLFILSTNSRASLMAMIQDHLDWVQQQPDDKTALVDLAYTLCHRRPLLPWRFSGVAHDRVTLLNGLRQGLGSPPKQRVPAKSDAVLIFTGQGAQGAGMGRELLLATTPSSHVFRDSIRVSRNILASFGAT